MSLFRYDNLDAFYKGNCHIHSTASDGGKTFPELAEMYAGQGYHFLFRTDHWVCSDVAADPARYPLLWLDGVELHGHDHGGNEYHVNCLGAVSGLRREMGLVAAMEAVRAQGGLLTLAHPHWIGNTFEDALRYGFDGVEVYNHVCRWLNGKGEAGPYWHALLRRSPNTLGLAVDDAHIRPEHPGWNGGWIMVSARELSQPAILSAIRAGRFYSSCGPEIKTLRWDGKHVHVTSSPVQFARLVGPTHHGARVGSFEGQTFTEAAFEVPASWAYAYLELEDTEGRRAWTNTLFVA